MKPVIKKQTHYSLLLMRDDAEARSYRIHGRVLRIFFTLLLLIAVGGGLGIAGGVHYWKKYRLLGERFESQEREVSDMRLQLERLITLETVLSASNGAMPQARHAQIGLTAPVSAHNATTELPLVLAATNGTANATVAMIGNASMEPSSANATFGRDNATAGLDAVASANATAASHREPGLPQISDQGSPLRITGFNGRATGQQRLRISYELSTEGNDDQRMISGVARYFAVLSNGTRMELAAFDSEGSSSRFSITRMKLMQTSARLPQGYRASDVEKIDVQIELSEGRKFEERFDVVNGQ